MSIYYDKKYQPISFQPGDKAYVSLAVSMETGYHLPNTVSHKLSPQRAGPFEVLRAVGNLAYELKVPASWKIHPVISVAHLEPFKDDPFQRLLPPVPDLITDDNSTPHEEWEVEDILKQRFNRRRKCDEWFVKWKDFGPEHNTWEPVENLTNSLDKIEEFKNLPHFVATASTFFLPSTHSPSMPNAFLSTVFLS
jgi:hypothetical protein